MSLLSSCPLGSSRKRGCSAGQQDSSLACHVPCRTHGLPARHSLSPAASREDKAATLTLSPSLCTAIHAASVCCWSGDSPWNVGG